MSNAALIEAALASLLVLGCRSLLDLPDDPQVVRPDHHGNGSLPAGSEPDTDAPSVAVGSLTGADAAVTSERGDGSLITNIGRVPADGGATAPSLGDAGLASAAPDASPGSPPEGSVTGEPSDIPLIPDVAACPLVRSLISNFTFEDGANEVDATFGAEASFVGGTYVYSPDAALASDVTDDEWSLSGSVSGPAGFGLVASDCGKLDASAFLGIELILSGELGSEQGLVFFVETAAQQVADAWANDNEGRDPAQPPKPGRCFPASGRYDGTCREPRVTLSVPAARTRVRILWQDLTGGSPVASVDPSEITSIAWALPEPTDGVYAADIHIDSLRFITP